MAINKKIFLAFVLTILFVVPSIHCSDNTSGFEIKQEYKQCYTSAPCIKGGSSECEKFCVGISGLLYGKCRPNDNVCCCLSKTT
ncbi:PREDICTED: putative defensin-like protein 111 [Camelina sativa]|uniref:Defensin-like protein 111 n=1 Tax=Camelina sativa TaxID=90675 RepID=A0ABM1R0U6_CAMSA|nr:PREDICTED: putative defensin-like protein 111 [Camelina sativa]